MLVLGHSDDSITGIQKLFVKLTVLVKTDIAVRETKQAVGMFENRQWQACTKPKVGSTRCVVRIHDASCIMIRASCV